MNINKNINVSINFDELSENISDTEIIKLIEKRAYYSLDVQEVLDALAPEDSELFEYIGDASINSHIEDNINYYAATSVLSEKINELQIELSDCEEAEKELTIPDNPELAKRFFCDLLNIGYHVSTQDVIRQISDKITRTRHQAPSTQYPVLTI